VEVLRAGGFAILLGRLPSKVGGPEFLTFFEDAGRKIGTGRTSSCRETVDAIWHWLRRRTPSGHLSEVLLRRLEKAEAPVDWETALKSLSEARNSRPQRAHGDPFRRFSSLVPDRYAVGPHPLCFPARIPGGEFSLG